MGVKTSKEAAAKAKQKKMI